jgi:glucose-1-phosphate adenylyltransferase
MLDVLGFILSGGRGLGLYPLTKFRSTPAVAIAGKYRLIDIPISNCINSRLARVYVLTQFQSVSLHRHIANTYKFAPFARNFVEVLAAQQTNETADWYRGTADALRQNIRYLKTDDARDVLILSADGLYRMNYASMVETHRASGADITFAVYPVRREQVSNYGIVRHDEQDRIIDLVEKPKTPEQIDSLRSSDAWLKAHGLADSGREYLANMGIYLCRRETLLGLLESQPEAIDLVTQHFARIVKTHRIHGHLFDGYWQDLGGSIRTYHEANLALGSSNPPFDFHSSEGVIYTRMRNLPASQIRASHVEQSLISDGCVVGSGTRLDRCLIGHRSQIGRDVTLRETLITGVDRYETEHERENALRQGLPEIGVGDGSIITRAIIDKDCRIGKGVRIVNEKAIQHVDTDSYSIRDGIVVIPKGTAIPDGTVI